MIDTPRDEDQQIKADDAEFSNEHPLASPNELAGAVTSCFSSAPTGLYANPTNDTSFTANWTALSGAGDNKCCNCVGNCREGMRGP